MPSVDFPPYEPRLFFKNGHVSTLYPYLFRKTVKPSYNRERWITPDDDFLDLDFLTQQNEDKLIVLNHGLEGSSHSQYIIGMANFFYEKGWNICAINNRSCSGELNKTLGFYHSGFTDDLNFILPKLSKKYKIINLIGFSLGGNQILKYLGEYRNRVPSNIKTAVTFSVPVDLKSSSIALKNWENKIYISNFLSTLKQKVKAKAELFPNKVDLSHLVKLKELMDFDEYYTSSLQGFKNANDYYKQSSSKQYLGKIKLPTLLVNAENDPFLGQGCYPILESKRSDYFHYYQSKYGGHAGFPNTQAAPYWTEQTALNWINDYGY